MGSKVSGLSYAIVGALVGGLVTIGITVGAGTANACVTASGTAVVDCDGMLQSDLSGSTVGAVDGHGGGSDTQGVENHSGIQGTVDDDGTQGDFCSAMPGSVPRC